MKGHMRNTETMRIVISRTLQLGLIVMLFSIFLGWDGDVSDWDRAFRSLAESPAAALAQVDGDEEQHEMDRTRGNGNGSRPFNPEITVTTDPPAGWGNDCTQWITYSDPWTSTELCYDPTLGAGGEGWRDCVTGEQVIWPALEIQLWIEMECRFEWSATHIQIHRASDYSSITIELDGGSHCNSGQYIITRPPASLTSLDYLPFVQDQFGTIGQAAGTDIPLAWEYNLNGAGWVPMTNLQNDPVPGTTSKYFLVPASDNTWSVRIIIAPAYHQDDGYYYLGGPGAVTCPANPL